MRRLGLRNWELAQRAWRIVAICLLVAVLATGCGAEATPTAIPSGITVTFEGDQCAYHGPERVPAGQIPIVLDVKDETAHDKYGVGAGTVEEGKTLEDLVAAPFAQGTPLWMRDHGFIEAARGTSQEGTVALFEGPLFLICFTSPPDLKTNVLGPIEIEPAVTK